MSISLITIKELLLKHTRIRQLGFDRLEIEVMREPKKVDYYGTSVKRYKQISGDNTHEKWGLEGSIHINLRDIGDDDEKLLRVVSEEVAHLADDTPEFREEIYQYLRKEL